MIDTIVKNENVKFQDNLEFQDSERLQSIYRNLKTSLNKYHNSKHEICFYLNQLKEFFDNYTPGIQVSCNYGRTGGLHGLYSFETFCETFFNFHRKTVQRYLRVYEKFFKDNFPKYHQDMLREFDISKLVALLSLENDTIRDGLNTGHLKYWMTRDEICKYVKSIGTPASQNVDNSAEEINEDEIPDAYEPSRHYDDKYFMGLAKSQLVNNIISLQSYCEKLQEQIKELKKKKAV